VLDRATSAQILEAFTRLLELTDPTSVGVRLMAARMLEIKSIGAVEFSELVALGIEVVLRILDALGEGLHGRICLVGTRFCGMLASCSDIPSPHVGLLAKGQGYGFVRNMKRLRDLECRRVCRNCNERTLQQLLL